MVYIEDTDAYGVLYNSNYLRAYERALFTVSFHRSRRTTRSNNNNNDDETPPPPTTGGLLSNSNKWILIGATEHKFKASPPLGGSFVITGRLLHHNENENENNNGIKHETWDMCMTDANDDTIVYNTAVITIGSIIHDTKIAYTPIPPLQLPESITTTNDMVCIQQDEFQTSPIPHIPLRTILNYFERSRTNFLGGPAVLRKMQTEGKIVWVVVKIDDCALVGSVGDGDGDDIGGGKDGVTESMMVPFECCPGQNVLVETCFRSKRRHMLVECYQTLFVVDTEEEEKEEEEEESGTKQHRVAQAVMTIMALDADTRRPCSNIPDWIVDILEGRGS